VTALLLQHGASGGEPNRIGAQPLEMGANQGSWRELHVILSAQPKLLQELGPKKGRKMAPMEDGYAPGGCLLPRGLCGLKRSRRLRSALPFGIRSWAAWGHG
jgi:hypothetical protein